MSIDVRSRGYIENAIRSLYQMILLVDASSLECRIIDHNKELRNISQELDRFDIFCEMLYANIHPEDREDFIDFTNPDYFPRALNEKVYVSIEARVRHVDHKYYWSKITFCNGTMEDSPSGNDYLFLIEDIDEYKSRQLAEDAKQRMLFLNLQEKYYSLFEENMLDAQTGCYNRKGMKYYIDIMLNDAKKTGKNLFVCVSDLNGLKHLNDTYGHAAGDEAIAAVSKELLAAAPQGSRIIRTGGDEFLLIAALDADSKEPEEFGDKLDVGLEEYNKRHPNPFVIGASYGWIFFSVTEDMYDLDKHIETADAKMYEMKMEKDKHHR